MSDLERDALLQPTEGDQVLLSGLQSRPTLNGKTGHVVRATNAATGRATVSVEGETLALKSSNLTVQPMAVAQRAIAISEQAKSYQRQNNMAAAMPLFNSALELGKRLRTVRWDLSLCVECPVHGMLSDAFMALGDWQSAAEQAEQAVMLARQEGWSLEPADVKDYEGQFLFSLGSSQIRLGKNADAIATLTAAAHVHKERRDQKAEAKCLAQIGGVHASRGEDAAATSLYAEALCLARAARDWAVAGQLSRALGALEYRAAEDGEAKRARDAALQAQLDEGLSRGRELRRLSDLVGARSCLQQCRALVEQLTCAPRVAYEAIVCMQSALVHAALEQHEDAIPLTNQAHDLFCELGDEEQQAGCLSNLAVHYGRLGRTDDKCATLLSALELSERTGSRRATANIQSNLGSVHIARAIARIHEEAERLAKEEEEEASEPMEADAEQALSWLAKALAFYKDTGDTHAQGVALGNIATAHRLKAIAAGWWGPDDETGAEQAKLQYQKALDVMGESLKKRRLASDRDGEAQDLSNIGLMYMQDGDDPQTSWTYLKMSSDLYEKIWASLDNDEDRISYGDMHTVADTQRMLQRVEVRLGGPGSALHTAERARARSLAVMLATQRGLSGASLESAGSLRRNEEGFVTPGAEDMKAFAAHHSCCLLIYSHVGCSLFAWAVSKETIAFHEVAWAAGSSLEQLVQSTRRAVGVAQDEVAAVKRSDHRRDAGSAAVEVAVSNTVFERSKNKRMKRELVATKDEDEDEDEGEGEGEDGPSLAGLSLEQLLHRCHATLIAPFAALIADVTHLTIIPDRELYLLPFAAILDPATSKHLIETHSISVAASVGSLIELERRVADRVQRAAAAEQQQPSQQAEEEEEEGKGEGEGSASQSTSARPAARRAASALVVGDPAFHGWAKQLKAASEEALQVKEALEGSMNGGCGDGACGIDVTLLTGEAATKEAVTCAMRESEYVHLATHGTADGVLLSGGSKQEGMLTMGEVQQLQLQRARLVVLSECDSFKGRLSADGVVGISRAFVTAGAATMVASLWRVFDEATRVLMGHFYATLLGEASEAAASGDSAVALQCAMVAMLREKAADGTPRFQVKEWASFVVYGLTSASADAAPIAYAASLAKVEQLLAQANERLEGGDARGAIELVERCRAEARAIRDEWQAQQVEAATSLALGRAFIELLHGSLQHVVTAFEHLTNAATVYKALGEGSESKVRGLIEIIEALLLKEEYEAEADDGDRSSGSAASSWLEDTATALYQLSQKAYEYGEREQAVAYCKAAAAKFARAGSENEAAARNLLDRLTDSHSSGDRDVVLKAQALLREGNRLFTQEEDSAGSVALFQQALAHAQQAASRKQRLVIESPVLLMLAQAYADLGERDKALECCQQAVAVCSELGNAEREGFAMAMLASLSEEG